MAGGSSGPEWFVPPRPDDAAAAIIPERRVEDRFDVSGARRLFRAVAAAKNYGSDDLNLQSIREIHNAVKSPYELDRLSVESEEVLAAWRRPLRTNRNAERFRSLAAEELEIFLRGAEEER